MYLSTKMLVIIQLLSLGEEFVIDWKFESLQNSHVEILTPHAVVLGGGVCGRQLGHEGRS